MFSKQVNFYFFLYERHFFWRMCIGMLVKCGKKSVAIKILRSFFNKFSANYQMQPFFFFYEVVDLYKPFFELRSSKNHNMVFPIELKLSRQRFLALKFLFHFTKQQVKARGVSFSNFLGLEILSLSKNTNLSLQLKYKVLDQVFSLKNKVNYRNNFFPKKELFKNATTNKFFDIQIVFMWKNLSIWF